MNATKGAALTRPDDENKYKNYSNARDMSIESTAIAAGFGLPVGIGLASLPVLIVIAGASALGILTSILLGQKAKRKDAEIYAKQVLMMDNKNDILKTLKKYNKKN